MSEQAVKTEPFETLEVGRSYLSREGKVIEIVVGRIDDCDVYPFRANTDDLYQADGDYWSDGQTNKADLVSRIVEVSSKGPKQTRRGKFMVYKKEPSKWTPDCARFEPYWYFTFVHTNGVESAPSHHYISRRGCLKGITALRKNAPDATLEIMK